MAWTRLPSVPFTLALVALTLPPVFVAAFPLAGNIWWVLKNGELLIQQGAIGSSDPFTFSPHVNADVNAQWLSQLAYYSAYRLLGLEGVIALTSLVVAASFGLLFHIARRRSGSLAATGLAMSISSVVAVWNLSPRAQSLALPPFAATYWLLACAPRRAWTIVSLAGAEAVWANLHGSFFIGPVLTALFFIGHTIDVARQSGWRRVLPSSQFFAAALAAQLLGSLATPNGAALYTYAWRLSTNTVIRQYVSEWSPTNFGQLAGIPFFASAALTAILVFVNRRRMTSADFVLLGFFGVLGLQAVRNVIWWGLVLGPIVAVACADVRPLAALARTAGSRRHNVLRVMVVALLVLTTSPWLKLHNPLLPLENRGLVPSDYPRASADYLLTSDLPRHIYADQGWGSYLDWRLYPRYQLMLDSSLETHPPDVLLDVLAIDHAADLWEQRLDAYRVDVLLLNRARQSPLIDAAEHSAAWQPAFSDDISVVFVRAEARA